jgi:hypothetical protein
LFAWRRDLFSYLDIVFFNATSIYFEGEGGETIGRRGHSKDHRPDRKQMVVGMVLTAAAGPPPVRRWFRHYWSSRFPGARRATFVTYGWSFTLAGAVERLLACSDLRESLAVAGRLLL